MKPSHEPKTAYGKMARKLIGFIGNKSSVELAVSLTGPRPAQIGERDEVIDGHLEHVRVFAPSGVQCDPDYYRVARSLRIGHKTL